MTAMFGVSRNRFKARKRSTLASYLSYFNGVCEILKKGQRKVYRINAFDVSGSGVSVESLKLSVTERVQYQQF